MNNVTHLSQECAYKKIISVFAAFILAIHFAGATAKKIKKNDKFTQTEPEDFMSIYRTNSLSSIGASEESEVSSSSICSNEILELLFDG
tara:strand:- start:3306 stop:3572 length:267 start_codon:yes stop_codon:yes gene_type:complete